MYTISVIPHVVLVMILACTTEADQKWCYIRDSECGPSKWVDKYEDCGGNLQSPINFVPDDAEAVSYAPFVFTGYDPEEENAGSVLSIKNVGHSAMIMLDGVYSVSGGGLSTEYKALQAHFHFGRNDEEGSEHTIDSVQYPLEMHIVHYANKWFSNGSEAVSSGNNKALAVLGVLFEISDEDNEDLDVLINGLPNIIFEEDEFDFEETISMIDILPEDITNFYRYNGSLTTPGCFEVVTWTVFIDTVPISANQLKKFRELKEGTREKSHDKDVIYRPIQETGSRKVYCSSAVLSTTFTSLTLLVAIFVADLIIE